MIGLKIWLTVAAATSTAAFVPNSLRDARCLSPLAASVDPSTSKKTSDAWVKGSIENSDPPTTAAEVPKSKFREVFPGVGIPVDLQPPALDNEKVNARVTKFQVGAGPTIMGLVGKPKSDGLLSLQKVFMDLTLSKYNLPDEPNYEFFGDNGQTSKILQTLLKVDSFFASALTKSKNGFELRAFDPEDPECKKNPSLYREIASSLVEGSGHRVNFFFNEKMEVTGYEVFDDVTGEPTPQPKNDIEYWAGSALYNTLFYASSVHATIHVLHYLMTSAFQFVSNKEDFEPMQQWANYYADNIQFKYAQVGDVLIRPPADPLAIDNMARERAAITGSKGFGSSAEVITPILARLLNTWGENPSAKAWFDNMMNISEEDMETAGILTEFRKHFDLVEPFSEGVAGAFKEINLEKASLVELHLAEYLKRCGTFTSKIDSLEDWIQLMAVTGEMHGSTLGYSRLGAMSEVMQWRNIKAKNWDMYALAIPGVLLGTICGMEEGDHVMTSTYGGPYDPVLQSVLDKFDGETTELKKVYEAEIQKDPDFADYGWILSEYCTDGFDGKQLTTATYI